ncbi:hypothetical protein L7F22_025035 [Adiantum nelumboides]|nr:hypothetical protein [Adiantum nelumboides]
MKAKAVKKDEIAKAREEKKAEKESKRLQILAEKERARQRKFHVQEAKASRKDWEAHQGRFENNLRSLPWEQGFTQGLLIKPLHLDTPYHAYARTQQLEKLKRKRQLDSVPRAKQVIELLYKKGFSSVGAVGFCWGGNLVVKLAKEKSLKAVVAAHPSFVTVKEIQEAETPINILAAELDTIAIPSIANSTQHHSPSSLLLAIATPQHESCRDHFQAYSRPMRNFSEIAAPPIDLLKGCKTKRQRVTVEEKSLETFYALQKLASKAPILKIASWEEPYEVITNASNIAIGAVLQQDSRPVAFYSKKLDSAQC